ncbi:hypothetical protein ABPG75_002463 [Micractinium tetrahymenae]
MEASPGFVPSPASDKAAGTAISPSAALSSTTVAIACSATAAGVIVIFLLLFWAAWSNCSWDMTWPWRRRQQAAAAAAAAASGGSAIRSHASRGTAEGDKPAGRSSLQAPAQQLVAVLVVQPDDSAHVGVTHVPAAAVDPQRAGATPAAISAPSVAASDSSAGSDRSSRRNSSEVRAAYLAELEEREAARRELSRRNAGLTGASGGGWGLSFFPYIL